MRLNSRVPPFEDVARTDASLIEVFGEENGIPPATAAPAGKMPKVVLLMHA
jgi:hypothetical protein